MVLGNILSASPKAAERFQYASGPILRRRRTLFDKPAVDRVTGQRGDGNAALVRQAPELSGLLLGELDLYAHHAIKIPKVTASASYPFGPASTRHS